MGGRSKLLSIIGIVALLAFAAALRLYRVEKRSFSIDESTSLFFATSHEWRALFWDNHPPLYAFILKLWLAIAPLTELGARSLSVLFSLIGVVALFEAGRWSGSLKRGFAAGFLFSVSTLSIRYSQEARMYELLEALTCVQIAILYYHRAYPKDRRALIALGATVFASALTHVFGLMATMLLFPGWVSELPQRHKHRAFLTMLAAVFAVATLAFFIIDVRYFEWQRRGFEFSASGPVKLYQFLNAFGQRDPVVMVLMGLTVAFTWIHRDERERRFCRSLLLCLGALVLAVFGFEWFFERRALIPRYLIFLNPLLIWLAVLGFETIGQFLPSAWLRRTLGAVALLGFAVFTSNAYYLGAQDWRGLAGIAVREKAELVMSTRPLGFGVPYYSSHGIPFERFRADDSLLDTVTRRLKTYKRIMIVDDNESRLAYHTSLILAMSAAGLAYRTFDFVDSDAGSVFGILIFSPGLSPDASK